MTAYKNDTEYLKQAIPDATDAEIEAFCEKVAQVWADGESVEESRLVALKAIVDKRN